MEVGSFFAARAGALVCRSLVGGEEMLRRRIQTFDDESSETGGNHDGGFQTKQGGDVPM